MESTAYGTRERILDAALRLFATHGLEATSMRDLAAEVGIRQPSIYKHFGAKQEILGALIVQGMNRFRAAMDGSGLPFDDLDAATAHYADITPDALAAAADAYLEFVLHDQILAPLRRILTIEQYRSAQAADLLHEWFVARPLGFQSAVFARIIAAGRWPPGDPDALALAFFGPIHLLLALAERSAADEADARVRLRAHLETFTAYHLSPVRPGER